jgi:hypothetical protein
MAETKGTKALIAGFAGATAVVGSLIIAVTVGSDGGAAITTPEVLQAVWVGLTAVGGALGVYQVTNGPKGE